MIILTGSRGKLWIINLLNFLLPKGIFHISLFSKELVEGGIKGIFNIMAKKEIRNYEYKFNKVFKQSQVILAYLFGSEARGTSHRESDIDIGVLFDKKISSKDYLKLEGRLIGFFSEVYPNKEINIVNFNIASPLLRQAAILEGKLLYAKNKLTQILFQSQTLREYDEYSHLSNIYNQFLERRLGRI